MIITLATEKDVTGHPVGIRVTVEKTAFDQGPSDLDGKRVWIAGDVKIVDERGKKIAD